MDKHCLFCYQEVEEGDYHPHCSLQFFGESAPPILDYSLDNLKELARSAISRSLSVTGVQEKVSLTVARNQEQHRLTIVGLWGDYILKPPSKRYPDMPVIEHLTMKMAAEAQIPTVPHALIRMKSGELAYITRRIDREKGGKIHMEDMCQLSGRLTEDKYRSSMEQVARIIRSNASYAGLDLLYFYEQTLFSFLTGNADMHLKNFSLFYPGEQIRLTPAYDMVSTRLLISEKMDKEELALTLNGKKRKFKWVDFIHFGENIGLKSKQIENVYAKFVGMQGKWEQLIQKSFLSAELQEKFQDLLTNRINRLQE